MEKGTQIALYGKIVNHRDGNAWYVRSETNKNEYYIVKDGKCTCKDFLVRGGPCKHMYAVMMWIEMRNKGNKGVAA